MNGLQDIRYALRMLRRAPGFTAAAVTSLALGIGANTAIFSVINTLMFQPLPVLHPEALVQLTSTTATGVCCDPQFSPTFFQRVRDRADLFSSVAAIGLYDRTGLTTSGAAGATDGGLLRVALVSGTYFHTLGVAVSYGRALDASDDAEMAGRAVAVVSDDYWRRRMSSVPDPLAHTVSLNGTTYHIVGVAARAFVGDWIGRPVDLWIPAAMQAHVMPEAGGRPLFMRIVARLAPGVSMGAAQAAAGVVFRQERLDDLGNPTNERQLAVIADRRLVIEPAAHGYSPERQTFGRSLLIMMAIVASVMLIACANVANLLLAHASARGREIALRRALGAGRGRIMTQTLTESALLAVLSGTAGLALSVLGMSALSNISLRPVQMDARAASAWTSFNLAPDWRVLLFTTILCALTVLLFGLAPALRGAGLALAPSLTGRGVIGGQSGQLRLGRALIVVQVAMSLVLVAAASLFVQTLRNLSVTDVGFDRQRVLFVWTAPVQTGRRGSALATLCTAIVDRLSLLPGVTSVSASSGGMLAGGGIAGLPSATISIQGQPRRSGQILAQSTIAPRYFQTLGLPVVSGREFTPADAGAPSVIVNETFARFFFGDKEPLGRTFSIGAGAVPSVIVGIVKDTSNRGPRNQSQLWSYVPYNPRVGLPTMTIVVRTDVSPRGFAVPIRQALRALDPGLPILKINTPDEQLADVLVQERLVAGFATVFGALALFMCGLGIYGVVAYTVARRTNEFGVRVALGATRSGLLSMVLKDSLSVALGGLIAGIPLTLAAMRVIASTLHGVAPSDLRTIVLVSGLMVAVAMLASLLPARRAAAIDPIAALRAE